MGKELEAAAGGSNPSLDNTSNELDDAAEATPEAVEGGEGAGEAGEAAGEAASEVKEGETEGEEAGAEGGEAAAASAGAAVDWKPEVARFKVDGKELEYDDKVRAILTKENEPIIRELQEKAHGIEAIKIRHEEVKGEREQLRTQLGGFVGQVKEILQHRDSGDYEAFLEACNIPFDKLAAWMHQKLKLEAELSPEQRRVYDENIRSRRERSEIEKTNQSLAAQNEEVLAQVGAMQLDMALADAGIKEVVDEFDGRMGKPGSFRRAVIQHAAAQELFTKQGVAPREAISSFLQVLGRSPGQAKPGSPAPVTAKPKVIAPHRPATIPNVGASAKSPAKSKINSVNDLRRKAKEMGV
jgi:hypothetical protein